MRKSVRFILLTLLMVVFFMPSMGFGQTSADAADVTVSLKDTASGIGKIAAVTLTGYPTATQYKILDNSGSPLTGMVDAGKDVVVLYLNPGDQCKVEIYAGDALLDSKTVSAVKAGTDTTAEPASNDSSGTDAAAAVLTEVVADVSTLNLKPGNSQLVNLTAKYSDGTDKNITAEADWASSDGSVAAVDKGLVTAAAPGSADITGTYQERTVTVKVAVASEAPTYNYNVEVYVYGNPVVFPDQKPFIDESVNRTYVPVRFVSEALGADVEWVGDEQKVKITKADKLITLTINNKEAYVNDSVLVLEAPPVIVNDRTMVPLRFVSEALGEVVGWTQLSVGGRVDIGQ